MPEFKAGDRTFEFDCRGRYVVAKIKCYASPELPKGYQKKLEQLAKWRPNIPEKIEEWAWNSHLESWWDRAKEDAQYFDLGKIHAEGRSGGYLAVDQFTTEYVQSLCADIETECARCRRPYSEHVNDKCLFSSSRWKSADVQAVKTLEKLKQFLTDCEESVKDKHAVPAMTEDAKYFIDDQWERMRESYEEMKRVFERSGKSAGHARGAAVRRADVAA